MKRALDGCPKCQNCDRRVEDPVHVFINSETKEDYCLCEACDFFRISSPKYSSLPKITSKPDITINSKEAVPMTRISSNDLLTQDFSTKTLEELQKIRHNLYARKCNAKDEAAKQRFENKITELKAAVKAKKGATTSENVENKPEASM